MEAKLYGQNKGGMSINGIIKDYYAYAGENISAGDLVEYVNGVAGKTEETSVDTQLSTQTSSGATISAVVLDENRVFIAHSYGSSYYLYGVVVTIEGSKVTTGSHTSILSSTNAGYKISTCLLPNGNVFIAHSYGSSYYLRGIVVSIDGTTITTGADKAIDDISYAAAYALSAKLLPNGKIFIAYSYDNNQRYLMGIACEIDGTTITAGKHKQLSNTNYTGAAVSVEVISSNRVFIAHNYYTSYYNLYGMTVTIGSDNTLTAGNDTVLSSTKYTGDVISTCLLANGNVFIAHSNGTNRYLYGIVCSISGTTISKGTDTYLSTTANSGDVISTCLLANENVLVTHSRGSDKQLYSIICSVNETTITKVADTQLTNIAYSGYAISSVLLDNGTIFVAHSYDSNYLLYAQIFAIENNKPTTNIIATEYETQIRKVTTGQFDGIAKTSGEGGDDTGHKDKVSIYVNRERSLVSGVLPLTLENTNGKQLINYRIEGNTTDVGSVGDKTDNLVTDGKVNYNALATYEPYKNGYKATTEMSTGGYTNYISIGTGLTPKWGATYTLSVKLELSDNNMSPLMRLGYWEFNPMLWKDFVNKSVDSNGVHSITFTLPSEQPANYYSELGICLFFNIQRNSTGNTGTLTITDMMLVEGSTTKDYEPSGYVIPITSRYKNLWSYGDLNSVNDGNKTFDVNLNGTYTMAFELDYESYANTGGAVFELTVDGAIQYMAASVILQSGSVRTKSTFTGHITQIKFINWCGLVGDVIKIQLEEGENVGDYEPCIVTNIYLDEPLRKSGNNADYINFANKTLVRKVNGTSVETIELPSIPTLDGTTILDSDVTVKPSKVEVEFYKE